MTVVYLIILLLIQGNNSEIISSGDIKLESTTSSSSNQFQHDTTGPKSGSIDAETACNKECLKLKSEIGSMFNAYPDHKTVVYIYNKCGAVTEGKYFPAAKCWCQNPNAPEGSQSTPVLTCRGGIWLLRTLIIPRMNGKSKRFSKTVKKLHINQEMSDHSEVQEVGMFRCCRSSKTNSPESSPPGTHHQRVAGRSVSFDPYSNTEARYPIPRSRAAGFFPSSAPSDPYRSGGSNRGSPSNPSGSGSALPSVTEATFPNLHADFNTRPDGDKEGNVLVTEVRIAGTNNIVRALIDTGSGFSIIHPKYKQTFIKSETVAFEGASKHERRIFGHTTIQIEIREGVTISFTGFITDGNYELLLGNDFLAFYRAKINILTQRMEILFRQLMVPMTVKFRDRPVGCAMLYSHPATYKSLEVAGKLNGRETRIIIDTAAAISVVNIALVDRSNLKAVSQVCTFAGSDPVIIKKSSEVTLEVGIIEVHFNAFVPDVEFDYDCVAGTEFIKGSIELIDFGSKKVTFIVRGRKKYHRHVTDAFIFNPRT